MLRRFFCVEWQHFLAAGNAATGQSLGLVFGATGNGNDAMFEKN
jgi:hypothetical protein